MGICQDSPQLHAARDLDPGEALTPRTMWNVHQEWRHELAPETRKDLELRVSWYLEMLERRRNKYCRLSRLCSSNKQRKIHKAALVVERAVHYLGMPTEVCVHA